MVLSYHIGNFNVGLVHHNEEQINKRYKTSDFVVNRFFMKMFRTSNIKDCKKNCESYLGFIFNFIHHKVGRNSYKKSNYSAITDVISVTINQVNSSADSSRS